MLAEDDLLVREGIQRLLETQQEIELAAVSTDLDSLLADVARERPAVVVTDIRMPPGHSDEGIRAAESLRVSNPEVAVLVLSQYVEPAYALRLLEHGTERRGYLLKERVSRVEQLVSAIREVAEGGSVLDPKVVETLVARSRSEESPLAELTARESEVLAEMAQGKNNAAVAKSLFLTERAVEKHINSIFSKLGLKWEQDVNRRVKAVLVFLSEQTGG